MGDRDRMVAQIMEAFQRFGADRYGEDVTQLQHALQCAQLARDHECADTLVAAALLHDIGRMLAPDDNALELAGVDAEHEAVGARMLGAVYPPAVTEPIRLHVAAKRYLCATEPDYADRLSAASQLSLAVQGGAADEADVAAFEREAFFADAVQLRRFDDWGKRIGCSVATLDSYLPLLRALGRDVNVRPD